MALNILEAISCYRVMLLPPQDGHTVHRHVFRELNQQADRIAGWELNSGFVSRSQTLCHICASCLAAVFRKRAAAPGGSSDAGSQEGQWTTLAWMCFPVKSTSITAGELEAAVSSHCLLQALYRGGSAVEDFLNSWQAVD